MKRALITGILGQDGAYLSKFLLERGYKVYGAYRRNSSLNSWRLQKLGIDRQVEFLPIELLEYSNIRHALKSVKPHEIYNLGAQSFVGLSFEQPLFTTDVNANAVTRVLEAIRDIDPTIRFYQASTSEMFGKIQAPLQDEKTPFYPRSPYGVGKLYAHWMTVNYREAYGMHASSGILFNHESPLRGLEFVSRKITSTFAAMALGSETALELGNLDAERDWGFAGDYVRGMWLMLQQDKPGDYVLATGQKTSVRKFVEAAGAAAGFDIGWSGSGIETTGIDRKSGRLLIRVNPAFFRPAEVDVLVGDASKARNVLGWQPEVSVSQLVKMMFESDLESLRRGETLM